MLKISVIVPVYYNEESLPKLFERLLGIEKRFNQKNITLELIFVDDGSADGSLKELLRIKSQREETKIIKLTRNFGSVHASKTGFQFATGDAFTILAADLQDPPELIEEMVGKWLKGAKYVVGVRASREDPVMSKFFSFIYYKLIRLFVIKDYPLGGFDMALMDKEMLPYFKISSKNLFVPILGHWLGYKPEVLYYHRQKRIHGRSRWTFYKKINACFDSVFGYSVAPLRLFSFIGIFVSSVSFIYGTWMIANAVLKKTVVPGFATIVVLISFLMGTVISMLSMIGEYLWRISDEVNKRPEVVIEKIY